MKQMLLIRVIDDTFLLHAPRNVRTAVHIAVLGETCDPTCHSLALLI